MSKINLEGFDLANPSKPQHVCIQTCSVFTGRASQTCEMLVLNSCSQFRHLETSISKTLLEEYGMGNINKNVHPFAHLVLDS